MAHSKKKNNKPRNKSGLLFIQKENKKGSKYTFNAQSGKRVNNLLYATQFTSKGKNTREGRDLAVKMVNEMLNKGKKVTLEEVKRTTEKIYIITSEERASSRKREEIILTEKIQQWSIRDYVKNTDVEKYFLKSPSKEFRKTEKNELLYKIEMFVESINIEVNKFNNDPINKADNAYIDASQIFIVSNEGESIMKIDLSNIELLKIHNVNEDQQFEVKENIYDRFYLSLE